MWLLVFAGEDLPPDVQKALDEEMKHHSSQDAGADSASAPGPPAAAGAAAAAAAKIKDAAVLLPERADVLVTDLLDHRCTATLPLLHGESSCYLLCTDQAYPSLSFRVQWHAFLEHVMMALNFL